jgi:hypothetical protein
MDTKIEIAIPNKVDEITIDQYQKYMTLIMGLGEDFQMNEFLKIRLVSIFCGIDATIVRDGFSSDDVDDIVDTMMPMLSAVNTTPAKFKPTFKIRDTHFGFITDFEKMGAGAFADLASYFGKWEDAHKFAAVVYRPVTKTKNSKLLRLEQYEIAEYNGTTEYAEIMRSMPVYKIIEANAFFYSSFIELRQTFLLSMGKKAQKELNQMSEKDLKDHPALMNSFTKSGIGTRAFTESVEAMSLRSMP